MDFKDAEKESWVRNGEARQLVLEQASIVGLTTTGALARRNILDLLMSPIVIAEEAAEVLEADIVASMTKHCKHLILLCDHKRLKPIVTHHLGTRYNMNVSLFERLVRKQIVRSSCLTTQYRMRPEISCLLKPHFYKNLKDAKSTLNRPSVKGLEQSVFFLHHEEAEDTVNGKTGFFNAHEVKMLMLLSKYLVSVGYSPSQITIITMYAEQRNKLIQERKKYPSLENLDVASVDSFQGKENDIILLSLVRNNKQRQIGFLKEETRICVVLSRAKLGLYLMGNQNCLTSEQCRGGVQNPTAWSDVLRRLKEQRSVGNKLVLFCQKHVSRLKVSKPEHWKDDFCRGCHEEKLLKERQRTEAERLFKEQKRMEEVRLLQEKEWREANRLLQEKEWREANRLLLEQKRRDYERRLLEFNKAERMRRSNQSGNFLTHSTVPPASRPEPSISWSWMFALGGLALSVVLIVRKHL